MTTLFFVEEGVTHYCVANHARRLCPDRHASADDVTFPLYRDARRFRLAEACQRQPPSKAASTLWMARSPTKPSPKPMGWNIQRQAFDWESLFRDGAIQSAVLCRFGLNPFVDRQIQHTLPQSIVLISTSPSFFCYFAPFFFSSFFSSFFSEVSGRRIRIELFQTSSVKSFSLLL